MGLKSLMQQKKKHICISDELPIMSSDYPWLVAQTTRNQIFYTLHDPMSHYWCQIPELVGRRIRACFHGWMILSKRNPQDMEWSLWNPVTSKFIWLPRMILKDDDGKDEFRYCCLSSPPDDPGSILLLMRSRKRNIVCILCNDKRRKRWTEISYSEEIKNIGIDTLFPYVLREPTCCNGNIYALFSRPPLLIQIQITVVEEEQVVMKLVHLANLPWPDYKRGMDDILFLKASCTQLFAVSVCLDNDYKPCDVCLYKFDMSSMVWTEIKYLEHTVFFVNVSSNDEDLLYSSPPIFSRLGGGYIHMLDETVGDIIYSYNMKDKTISLSYADCLGLPYRKSISIWTLPESRLHGKPECDDGDQDRIVLQQVTSATTTNGDDDEVEQMNEAPLLNVPFDVLENIMKFCLGIEYLSFRATCKLCRLAAPMQTFSSASPWLMVLDKDRGIVTFTDPVFGHNNYLIKASPELFYHHKILCSRHGWLLLYIANCRIAFFNPFTTDIRKLPELPKPLSGGDISFSFSAPPTSPDCMVVAFSRKPRRNVAFHCVGGEPSWHTIPVNDQNMHDFCFPICCGKDVYTLITGGGLDVFRGINDSGNFSEKTMIDWGPERSGWAKYYQVRCDQHHLLVIVEEYGGSVEVFELNECTREWEEIDCLERHMIYICDTSCVCMDAKIPEMENKIYFPRLHSENGKMVFYSLETSRFHTFNGRNVEHNLIDLFGTKQTVYAHAWIEPTWS